MIIKSPVTQNNIRRINLFLVTIALFIAYAPCSWPENDQQSLPVMGSGALLQDNEYLLSPQPTQAEQETLPDNTQPEDFVNDSESRVWVRELVIDGLPVNYQKVVNKLLKVYENKNLTLGQLNNITFQIEKIMQQGGDKLNFAYLPPQDITTGVVQINVVQGVLEQINLVKNESNVNSQLIERFLQVDNKDKGDLSKTESILLRLSDQPGIGPLLSVLTPGQTIGSSVLNVTVGKEKTIATTLMADNSGSRYVGRIRAGKQVTVNSPTGRADRLQGLILYAPEFLQNRDANDGHTVLGRLSYDLPVGYQGGRAGLAYSRVNYLLGGKFQGLGDGDADVTSLYASWPLIRSASDNLTFGIDSNYKLMKDQFITYQSQRKAVTVNISLAGNHQRQLQGRPGTLSYTGSVTMGHLYNQDQQDVNRGEFLKWQLSAVGSQWLHPLWTVNLTVSSQFSNQNLDPVEKMGLGGPAMVRAYNIGTLSADRGIVVSPSLNLNLSQWVDGLGTQLFYDYGQGALQTDKLVNQANHIVMQGYGAGVNYRNTLGSLNISYARRIGLLDPIVKTADSGRWWFSGAVYF